MPKFMNPDTVAKPTANYSQCVEVSANARRLIISGQVGAAPDGTVAKGAEAQTEQIFDNLEAVLKAAGMELKDVVKIVSYCVGREPLAGMRTVRARRLGNHAPTSTLVVVAGLANPDYLIEIEAEAVREG
jgi:2-iminobutanoate/2-iminopropanoate deaminase